MPEGGLVKERTCCAGIAALSSQCTPGRLPVRMQQGPRRTDRTAPRQQVFRFGFTFASLSLRAAACKLHVGDRNHLNLLIFNKKVRRDDSIFPDEIQSPSLGSEMSEAMKCFH